MRPINFLSLLALAAVPALAQVSFVAPLAFEDLSPFQVVQGHFYGSPNLDLVSIDSYSVNLYRNDGHGHFAHGTAIASTPPSSYFFMAAVGDFNHDGKPDIAVLESSFPAPGGFFLLLNQGNGAFTQTPTTVPQNAAALILAGDFNGDGNLDIAAISSSIEVFPGNGMGGFGSEISTPLSQTPASAVAADFNGDHKLDLAFGSSLGSDSVFLYTGNGDGTFTAGATMSVPGPAVGMAAADLNGDGNIDLLSAISGLSTASGTVDVFLGNGDGTFMSPVAYPTPRSYSALFLTDVNNDGKTDVIVGSAGSGQYGGAVSVLFGNGDGTLQPAITSEMGIPVLSVVAGDYNGDGVTDIAFTQVASFGGTTEVAFGTGGGRFQQPGFYTARNGVSKVFAGNFLGTGAPDILSMGNGFVQLFTGKGNGAFNKGVAIPVSYFYPGIGVQADFNGDGLPDIAVAGSAAPFGGTPSGLQVFLGQKGSTLAPGPSYPKLPVSLSAIAAGDINGDGLTDLVLTCNIPQSTYLVAIGTGGGKFQIGSPMSYGVPAYVPALGDFNGDGKADLVVAGQGAYILISNGDGTFQSPVVVVPPNINNIITAAGAIDLNGDGKLDLVLAGSSTLIAKPGSTACVLLGNGDGTFQKPVCYQVGSGPVGIAFADYNLDGNLDIATVNGTGEGVSIFLGHGDGSFDPARGFGVGSNPGGIATADFNGDGKPDLVTANSGPASSISVLLNNTKH